MRQWRSENLEPEESRARRNARAYANVYLKRGKIERTACVRCGGPGENMHHADYSKPLEVTWMCRPCHLAEHGKSPGRYREPSVDGAENSGTV
jgi:rubrerythrin